MPSNHSSHVYRTHDDRGDADEYVVVERPGRTTSSSSRIRPRHPSPPHHVPAATQSVSTATNPRSSTSYHRDPPVEFVHRDSRELRFVRGTDDGERAGREVRFVRERDDGERESREVRFVHERDDDERESREVRFVRERDEDERESREVRFVHERNDDERESREVEVVRETTRETTREERDSARERESALELAKETGKEVQLVRSVRYDSDDEHKDEHFYTRDDGVLVVRAAPEEIEIVEQVVPVPVRSDRSRRKSLDMRGADSPAPYKRLIVACDGTWLNADNGMNNGELAIPSNVTRFSRAIRPIGRDGIPQIVYYHFGVGSRGNVINRVVGGTTGGGLEENIRESYSFLSNNYTPGDEIYLVGFSRGAFTARSISGLICEIGILTKKGLGAFPAIFQDVHHRRDPEYRDKNPDIPFPNKPNAGDPTYREELYRRGLTRLDVTVKAIGVWDTVGALGTPRIGLLTRIGLQPTQNKDSMTFYDTKLHKNVEHAFQALSLDESRSTFAPAIWEKPRGNRTILRQVWFPGVHTNVGGGYDDQQLANITLAWMVSQFEPFIDFRIKYILDQDAQNARWYTRHREKPRPWSFGEIPDSNKGIYALGGSTTRTPGQYYAVDPRTGRPTSRPLRDTCEYMHPSVRTRLRLGGPGVEDKGRYDPEALDDWRLVVTYPDRRGSRSRSHSRSRTRRDPDEIIQDLDAPPDVFWKLRRGDEAHVSTRILPEAPLRKLERAMADRDPRTLDYVMWPPSTGKGGGPSRRDGGRGRRKSGAASERDRKEGRERARTPLEWRRSVG